MPSYTVAINGANGPGFMTVNASDAGAAAENARAQGATSTGSVEEGGHQAHTGTGGTATAGYPSGYNASGNIAQQTANNPTAAQYAAAIQQATDALAAGNREAFQRAILEADRLFQLDKDKFAQDVSQFNQTFGITQSGVTGQYQGAPTLPALTSYATQFGQWGVPQTGAQTLAAQQQNAALYGFNPTLGANGVPMGPNGQPLTTLAAQNQAYTQQLGVINAAAALQANPFRQQQVIGQLGGVLGGGPVAAFQAPNVVQGVGTAGGNTRGGMGYMQQLIDDIKDPTPNTTSMNQVLDAIPTPNKINSVEFHRASPSTQSMVLQGMQEKYGISPEDAQKQITATLPQFTAPGVATGTLKR